MRVMLVGTDRTLFAPESAVRTRLTRLGKEFEALDSIVFSTRTHGIRVVAEIAPHIHAHPTNSFSRFLYMWDALRIARRLPRPDIVSAQDPFETGLAGLFIAHHFGIPLAVEVHTDFLSPAFTRHSLLNRIRVVIARFVLSHADGGYAVSARVAEALNRRYHPAVPLAVVPIFVDLARFRALVRAPERNNLLWVGRFEAEKDPVLALQAFAAARRAGIDARLTMLGVGLLEPSLKSLATTLGVAEQVSFPGWKDVAPYFARADLMLVTSAYEGYGMALVEALAAGVPVLSTDVGIARGAGAVIAHGDYAAALQDWLQGPRAPGVLTLKSYVSEEVYLTAVRDCYAMIVRHSRPNSSL
ncbi:MAG: glycosyltransferase [Candidatus Parcubacteria bacterium]|nr:glycosyltransferase [Candidatus Parcubacteria bacterium]